MQHSPHLLRWEIHIGAAIIGRDKAMTIAMTAHDTFNNHGRSFS
jgi:hypothetical protein